jgi:hypothetical protein
VDRRLRHGQLLYIARQAGNISQLHGRDSQE